MSVSSRKPSQSRRLPKRTFVRFLKKPVLNLKENIQKLCKKSLFFRFFSRKKGKEATSAILLVFRGRGGETAALSIAGNLENIVDQFEKNNHHIVDIFDVV